MLFVHHPVVGVLPEFPTLRESLLFQGTGLLVVLMALCSIWGLLEITGVYFKRADQRRLDLKQASLAAATVPAEPAKAGDAVGAPGISAPILAVIAGAVHVALGGPHRIHSVKPAEPPVDWAREGRRQIFASHKVR